MATKSFGTYNEGAVPDGSVRLAFPEMR